jgi:hypothetical protein
MRHYCLRERGDHSRVAGSGGNERRRGPKAQNYVGYVIKFGGDEPSCVEWIFADQLVDDRSANSDKIRRTCCRRFNTFVFPVQGIKFPVLSSREFLHNRLI